jgi:hypothetical protein
MPILNCFRVIVRFPRFLGKDDFILSQVAGEG